MPRSAPRALRRAGPAAGVLACLLVLWAALPSRAGAADGAPESSPSGGASDAGGDELGTHAPPPGGELTPAQDPRARLTAAVRRYHSGQHDLALSLLAALLRDAPDDPAAAEARIYMGEIFFVQGNEAGAREAFESALSQDPDLRLDPFRHPPDVCVFFELVKDSWTPPPPPPEVIAPPPEPVPRRPSPWLPLGLAQYRQGRTGAAVALTTTQVLACGLSAGLGSWLLLDRRTSSDATPGDAPVYDSQGHRLWPEQTLATRRALQLSATGACYAAYGLGVYDAARAERRRTTATLQPQLGLPAGAAGSTVGLRLELRR